MTTATLPFAPALPARNDAAARRPPSPVARSGRPQQTPAAPRTEPISARDALALCMGSGCIGG